MGQHASHTFHCDAADGERPLIRVCLPGVRTDAELDAELIWLAALTRDTDLFLAIWYLADGLPDDEGHLNQLKALTRR